MQCWRAMTSTQATSTENVMTGEERATFTCIVRGLQIRLVLAWQVQDPHSKGSQPQHAIYANSLVPIPALAARLIDHTH
eukprot:COSAG02_NODE_1277_length_13502_cov_14.551593_8_plen_79_part_00